MPKRKDLSLQEKTFCELYASDKEFFGNGVQSYIEAYNVDMSKKGAYNRAKANAHVLLTKGYILDHINELFDARGLNDTYVDKQLEKLITQDAEFNVKIKAIAEYNKLKGRITEKSKVELTDNRNPFAGADPSKLEQMLNGTKPKRSTGDKGSARKQSEKS